MGVTVTYDSNNSGGSWWLSDEDWDKLAAAGWNVHWITNEPRSVGSGPPLPAQPSRPVSAYTDPLVRVEDTGERFIGARACSAAKEFERPEDAIAEFERVTGQDASAEGCNCCGPPHGFEYKDEKGETHYASARVTATAIDFS